MTNESALIEANPQTELSLDDLRKLIADRETKIDAECQQSVSHQLNVLKLVIEQGRDLLECKARVGHGDWYGWLGKNFSKSIRTAQGYMTIYKRCPNPQRFADFTDDEASLRAFLKTVGLLPVVESEQKQLTGFELPPIFAKLAAVADWVAKSGDVINDWDLARRRDLKAKIKPLVELYAKL